MRRSYSLYQCSNLGEASKFEESLQEAEDQSRAFWDDPENFYGDGEEEVYYNSGFDWKERNNPCSDAYFSPDRKASRNILVSNLGIMAKKGNDNIVHVIVNDLLSALPLNEVTVDVFDLQMQLISSGTTNQDGSVSILC